MNIPYPDIIQVTHNEYELDTDYSTQLPNGDYLTVKKGFRFDGASTPRIFWSIIGSPFTGKHTKATFIHDCLYASECYTRKECDWIMLEIMQYTGVSWWKRNIMWSAVRVGGGSVWRSHEKGEVLKARSLITIN